MVKKQLDVKLIVFQYSISMIVNVPLHLTDLTSHSLTDLTHLITFFILILLHTVSKIGTYGLLYILTYSF